MNDSRFWNEKIETMNLQDLRELQERRLQSAVEWAYNRTKFYRDLFNQAGLRPQDISTLEDIRKIPFTTDIEVASHIPLRDRLAVPEEDIKMFHSTSGTVGAVVPIAFTRKDEEVFLKEGEARGRWTMGVRPSDVVQVLTRFDCCSLGYRELGVASVLMSAGRYNIDHQILLTQEAGVTVIEHMPSFLLSYFETMEKSGIKVEETRLRMVSGVGEGWADSYKKKVEEKYGLPFMTLYGAVETAPFFAAECEAREGMHINADLGILEVVDPDTGEALPDGEEGELIVTLFQREAMPLLRYRVGDIGSILPYERCSCGRTMPKMSYVKGRVSQIIKVREKRILPIDIEEVVGKIEGLENEFRIILEKPEIEKLKIKLEYKDKEVKDMRALRIRAEEAFHNEIGEEAEVILVPEGSLERVTFKAQRIEKTY